MYIYVETHAHLCGDPFTFMWRPMYIYVQTAVHLCGDRCTFMCRPLYIYVETAVHLWNTVLNSSKNEKYLRQNLCSKSKHTAHAMHGISNLKHFTLFLSVH